MDEKGWKKIFLQKRFKKNTEFESYYHQHIVPTIKNYQTKIFSGV